MKIVTFQDALHEASRYNKKHLLLGNGFSIACVPSIFTYSSLYSKAVFSDIPQVQKTFESLGTQDFELVIHALEKAGTILPAYLPTEKKIAKSMIKHAELLKERLIQTIAHNHPSYPGEIEERKYRSCIQFLGHFLNNGGTIYTLNYDLLLYWTLMYGMGAKLFTIDPLDGFGRDSDFEDGEFYVSSYVTWQGDTKAHGQNIHYLHGALHIYDRGPDVEKFTWNETGVRLIDQSRKALSEGRFPLFVMEGESKKRWKKSSTVGISITPLNASVL